MPVSSVMDLYLTIFGWHMYGGLWSVITGSGLVMLPFLVKVVTTLMEDSEKDRKDVRQFVRNLEFGIYSMLAVMVFCAQPTIDLHLENMRYSHVSCRPNNDLGAVERVAEDLTVGDTGTVSDRSSQTFLAALDGEQIKTPLWWYLFARLSHAITFSLTFELPCSLNFTTMAQGLSAMKISNNPELRSEVGQFHKDCWVPSMQRFIRDTKDRNFVLPPSLANDPKIDTSWIGSNIFQNLEGYYDEYRALTPVESYFWIESRDAVMATQEAAGDRGFPKCDEWWEPVNSNIDGLRERLLDHLKNDPVFADDCDLCIGETWRYYSDRYLGTDLQRVKDDTFLRAVLSSDQEMTKTFMRSYNQTGFLDKTIIGAANLGILKGSATNVVESIVYKQGATIVQAIILMMFVAFLPLLLTISQFNIGTVVTLSVLFFSVIFWTYLFTLADFFENYLMESMVASWSDAKANEVSFLNALQGGMFANESDLNMLILKWIARMSYIGFPGIFTVLMGMIGYRAGNGLNGAMTSNLGNAAGAGGQTVGMVQNLITRGK